MPLIDLETAVDHILRACKAGHQRGHSPFFFLVGGGISHPPIPLASEIVEHCKAKATKECTRTTEPPGKQIIDIYSHWFDQAYPQTSDRQEYLRKLIESKPISHANLRLAHLLLEKTITNLVITTNFDGFLSRALTLFGKPHIVCDHPSTVGRIHPDHDDIQIIHVHGTYWFYDCCNLRGEIENRSQSSPQTTMTMAALLDRVLWDRSPLVIGYSGWEGDAIMTALRRRLESQNPLPCNLYWFCYRRAEVDLLPKWLKDHQQVYFVVPPQPALTALNRQALDELLREAESRAKKQKKSPPSTESKGFPEKDIGEPILSAERVLKTFIQTFALKSPELTIDPLGFFAKHLRDSLILENVGEERSDIYYISSVIDRIRQANKSYTETIPEIESKLESVLVAMRRSQYREAVKLAVKIGIHNLTPAQLCEFMDAMWSASLELHDNSEEERCGYDLVIATGNMLLKQRREEPTVKEMVAGALFNKGYRLETLNQGKEAIAAYDKVVRRFGEETEPVLRKLVAWALVNKGRTLRTLNQDKEAIAVYDEVVRRFGEKTEPALREQVANALVYKGYSLGTLNQSKEEIAVYDEVVRRFGEATEPALSDAVATALNVKGITLRDINRREEAIAVYNEVVKRFGEATEPALRREVVSALISKGFILGDLNRNEEEIAVYDEVVKRFGEATEPALREEVATALNFKGITLRDINRNEDAIAVFDEVVKRFGEATESALRREVVSALVNKGITLLRQGKDALARHHFSEVVKSLRGNQNIDCQLDNAIALSGLQRFNEAQQLLKQLTKKVANDPKMAKMMAKDCLSDLELMASAPQPPEGIQEFLARVREILGLK